MRTFFGILVILFFVALVGSCLGGYDDVQPIEEDQCLGPQEPPLLTGDEWNESLYFWLMDNIINMKSDPPIPNGTSPYERIDTLYVEFDSVYWHGYLTVQETEELNRLIALYLDGLER